MKKSFVLYQSQREFFETLSDKESKELILAIFDYDGKKESKLSNRVEIAFISIKDQLQRDIEKWEEQRRKRKEAGRLGGLTRAKNEKSSVAMLSNGKQTLANQAVDVDVDVDGKLAKLLGDSFKVEDGIAFRRNANGWSKIHNPTAYLKKIETVNTAPETPQSKGIDARTFDYSKIKKGTVSPL